MAFPKPIFIALIVGTLGVANLAAQPDVRAVTNGADFTFTVSPGSLATIFGTGLSNGTAYATSKPLPFTLNNVGVTVNGVQAALLYVSTEQINFQVPYETTPGTATVTVSNSGAVSNAFAAPIAAAAPALFQDKSNHAIAQNENGTMNSASNPAATGTVLIVYLTGIGEVSPAVADGAAALGAPNLSKPLAKPTASIGGVNATVQFLGLAPGFVGLAQGNILVPSSLGTASYPLTIALAGTSSTAVSVSIQGTGAPSDAYIVPNSAVPLQQWTGDLSQMYSAGRYFSYRTNAQSQTNYGVWGQGAGTAAQFPDGRLFFFFGDTVTAYKGSDGNWYDYQRNNCGESGRGTCIGVDTIGFIPNAGNLSQCNYLSEVDSALQAGQTPTTSYGACPAIQYLVDPSHVPTTQIPRAAWTQDSSVTGLVGEEGVLADRVPTGAFVVNNTLYTIYEAITRKPHTQGLKYDVESMLLRANQPTTSITGETPITWTRLYPWSSANLPTGYCRTVYGSATVTAAQGTFSSQWVNNPRVWQSIEIDGVVYQIQGVSTDGSSMTLTGPVTNSSDNSAVFNVLPAQNSQPGKFASSAPFLLGLDTMNATGIESQLPGPLKGLNSVLFVIGSGYFWRSSNVFLMAMDPAKIDGSSNNVGKGVADAWYLTSGNTGGGVLWAQGDETNAVPLMTSWQHRGTSPNTPCVGELSVQWVPLLNRFVMTYGQANCGGIYARTSKTPWGPWSFETQVFSNSANQGWEGKLVYGPNSGGPDFNSLPLIYDGSQPCCVGMPTIGISPWGQPGNPFAPFMLPAQTDNGDGSVQMYMNLSTFDPYVVFLTSFEVQKPH